MYVRDKRSPIPKNEAVSRVMSANRAKNTKPELTLRKALWHAGARGYRLHRPIRTTSRERMGSSSSPHVGTTSRERVGSSSPVRTTSRERTGSSAGWSSALRTSPTVRPDISFVSKKIAIFVNGCYWHRCQ